MAILTKIYCYMPSKKRPRWQTAERDAFLRENKDVDVSMLADALKLNYRLVLSYMQRLGLRPFTDPRGYAKARDKAKEINKCSR